MSLILTSISHLGIVHAADSNLTDELDQPAGEGQKVFELPYLRGGLSVAGCYSVGGVAMDAWMAEAILDYEHQDNPTLRGFSDSLRGKLEKEMTPDEKCSGSIVHVAGLVVDADGEHPEFYLVSNVTGIDPTTGAYLGTGESFGMSEDFWSRDFSTASARSEFASGEKGQIYINTTLLVRPDV